MSEALMTWSHQTQLNSITGAPIHKEDWQSKVRKVDTSGRIVLVSETKGQVCFVACGLMAIRVSVPDIVPL